MYDLFLHFCLFAHFVFEKFVPSQYKSTVFPTPPIAPRRKSLDLTPSPKPRSPKFAFSPGIWLQILVKYFNKNVVINYFNKVYSSFIYSIKKVEEEVEEIDLTKNKTSISRKKRLQTYKGMPIIILVIHSVAKLIIKIKFSRIF